MTGREIIIYILENSLENVEMIPKEDLIELTLSLIPIEEVASMTNLGEASVRTWADTGYLDTVVKNGKTYVVRNDKFKVFAKLRA